ncbi:MAG TPA: HAD family phosphatase [Chloroflexi bacterium]|nr:HAD family phosphatase [Chloroflexota bacterium]
MKTSNGIHAVIFDLDGLMVDSEPLAEWAWRETLARYGCLLDEQTFQDILGLRVADSARVICERYPLPVGPEEAMAERDRLFLDAVPARLRACAGLYPLLDALACREIPLALATSGHRVYVDLVFQTLDFEDRFRAVVTGDEVANGKPAPDIYLLAAERLGVAPERCLALEDSVLGARAAEAAGMVCLVVPNDRMDPRDFPATCRLFDSLERVRDNLDDLLA